MCVNFGQISKKLETVRDYLLEEQFQLFWYHVSPTCAETFLVRPSNCALLPHVAAMKKIAGFLREYRLLILKPVPGEGDGFNRRGGGLKQRSEINYQKSVLFLFCKKIDIVAVDRIFVQRAVETINCGITGTRLLLIR